MRTLSSFLTLMFASVLGAQTIVIQNATVLPVTKPSFKGSVVMKDGKITDVGEKVIVPAGATIVDGSGKFLMPGIIDCHSHLAADAINEGSVSVSSMVFIQDVLNPDDIAIYRALAGGVTTANVLHGSANAIGGKCSVIKMRWGKRANDLLFEGSKPGIKFALGENPKRQGTPNPFTPVGTPPRYPATREGVEDVIREAFFDAKNYQKDWKDYEAKKAKGEDVMPPRRDLKLEPLVEILEGKRLVHAHCYRADEILMLLRLADEMGFKVRTLQHVLEGYKVANEIKAHGAGASTFSDWWAYKIEAYDAIPFNAALMEKRGIVTSINSDSDELMRHLNTEAAKTVKYGGLTDDQALALITINPAKQLMIDQYVGSIEVGKTADLVLYDKHPLSNYARVQKVFIDGREYFDIDQDLKMRQSEDAEKAKLIAEEESERKRALPPGRPGAPTERPARPAASNE